MSKFDQLERRDKHRDQSSNGDPVKEVLASIDKDSEILKSFRQYATELDKKHDRYERIGKLSRDVTIESKRIIFLLHSVNRGREEKEVIAEASKRLTQLVKDCLFKIAKELDGEDPYMYHRAFTFGLQEFIEAYTYYHYLLEKNVHHWDFYQNLLKYNQKDSNEMSLSGQSGEASNEIMTFLSPVDFILGVADLTGELMRKCVNSLGAGDLDGCFETCEIVRKFYAGFLSIASYKTKEMVEKTYTLRQSLLKMEKVCYNINMRSKELPKQMLAHLANEPV